MKIGPLFVPRFWAGASLLVLVNFLAIGIVLLRGDPRDTVPLTVNPADQATGVSTRPIIQITYERAIDPASARLSLRLAPPTSGAIDVNGSVITFTPARPLVPDTKYSVTLAAGLREATGKAASRDASFSFKTRPTRLVLLRWDGAFKSAWAVEPETGKLWHVTSVGGASAVIAPSADGNELAFVVENGPDRWSLAAVRVVDGVQRQILPAQNGTTVSAAWSPSGDLLAYESSTVFGNVVSDPSIWLVRADGTQTTLLYGRNQETASYPSWSPDGRQLAFYENRLSAIAIFNFTRTLLTVPADSRVPATWSPDGTAIAYSDRTGDVAARSTLKVARLGSNRLNGQAITDGQSLDLSPTWSPDGAWIAFDRLTPTGQNGVWIVHPDGSASRVLQQATGWQYTAPHWSPDGSAVAFSRFHVGAVGPHTDPDSWIAPLGGSPRQLNVGGEVAAWIP